MPSRPCSPGRSSTGPFDEPVENGRHWAFTEEAQWDSGCWRTAGAHPGWWTASRRRKRWGRNAIASGPSPGLHRDPVAAPPIRGNPEPLRRGDAAGGGAGHRRGPAPRPHPGVRGPGAADRHPRRSEARPVQPLPLWRLHPDPGDGPLRGQDPGIQFRGRGPGHHGGGRSHHGVDVPGDPRARSAAAADRGIRVGLALLLPVLVGAGWWITRRYDWQGRRVGAPARSPPRGGA
jgi:hypothetical protein